MGELRQSEIPVPNCFSCPITREIMEDPVCTSDGHSYERVAIQAWLLTRRTSPSTNLALPSRSMTPNIGLKQAIQAFLEQRPEIERKRLQQSDLEWAISVREQDWAGKVIVQGAQLELSLAHSAALESQVRSLGFMPVGAPASLRPAAETASASASAAGAAAQAAKRPRTEEGARSFREALARAEEERLAREAAQALARAQARAEEERLAQAVVHGDYYYASLDNADPEATHPGGQMEALPLPEGWDISPAEPTILSEVIAAHPWGTFYMLCVDGNGYLTPLGAERIGKRAGTALTSGTTPDQLRAENGGVGPAKYGSPYGGHGDRVLIRRTRPAGPP